MLLSARKSEPGAASPALPPSSPSSAPTFSLVIATYRRQDELRRCLGSLANGGERDFEVILVDQNPGDELATVVEEFARVMPLLWLRQELPAASRARNVGAEAATGQWLGFPDDDCCFLPSTLSTLRRKVEETSADLLTGITVDENGEASVLDWHAEEASVTNHLLRGTIAESTLYIRRDLFLSVGGFDPAFGPGSIFPADEGVDLIRRIWSSGPENIRMHFCPDLRFFHPADRGPLDPTRLQRTRNYARGRGACAARHWRRISLRRALLEITKHLAGCVLLRGSRRRARYVSLLGYMEGFLQYQFWRTSQHRR